MSHLKRLVVTNIQSHRNTTIEFHPGVNAIIGPSDCGKSTLIRAIKKVAKNRPSGEAFRSNWGGRSLIELEFADGEVVGWMKGEKTSDKATYYVGEDLYVAFKTDVPDEVSEAVNFSDVNMQSQMDQPFLLADSAPEVAKVLNKASNLTQIDESISNIRKRVLSNGSEMRNVESQIQELEAQKESFLYLVDMERDVAAWEALELEGRRTDEAHCLLDCLIKAIEKAQTELDELESFLKAEEGLTHALTLVESLQAVGTEAGHLNTLIYKVEKDREALKEIETFLLAEIDLSHALDLSDAFSKTMTEIIKLESIIKAIALDERRVESTHNLIEASQQKFDESFPNTCPLCGGTKC